ncbi:glycosyltransferase family 4 protein [Methanohalobium evestigatum]|nr:glycosyltransferase family 4 protein [Methanohalobium evestigatum]
MKDIAEHSSHEIDVLTNIHSSINSKFDNNFSFGIIRRNLKGITGELSVIYFLLINRKKYDVIYLSRLNDSIIGLVAYILGKKVISHAHGSELIKNGLKTTGGKFPILRTFWENLKFKLNLNLTYKLIAVSEWSKNKLIENGANENKVHIVHPGIDFYNFSTYVNNNLRNELNICKSDTILLTVSRLHPRKGHRLVMDAISKMDNVHYLIIGKGYEEDLLKQYASSLNINDKVDFLGYVNDDDLPNYYQTCDIFIMTGQPSEKDVEGFGIAYLEANAAGKPVIGTDIYGVASAVKDNETGLLVEPTVKSIKNGIEILMNNNIKREYISKNSIYWAKKHDWSQIIKIIDDILSS